MEEASVLVVRVLDEDDVLGVELVELPDEMVVVKVVTQDKSFFG